MSAGSSASVTVVSGSALASSFGIFASDRTGPVAGLEAATHGAHAGLRSTVRGSPTSSSITSLGEGVAVIKVTPSEEWKRCHAPCGMTAIIPARSAKDWGPSVEHCQLRELCVEIDDAGRSAFHFSLRLALYRPGVVDIELDMLAGKGRRVHLRRA